MSAAAWCGRAASVLATSSATCRTSASTRARDAAAWPRAAISTLSAGGVTTLQLVHHLLGLARLTRVVLLHAGRRRRTGR